VREETSQPLYRLFEDGIARSLVLVALFGGVFVFAHGAG
jgi:hypothetical protein